MIEMYKSNSIGWNIDTEIDVTFLTLLTAATVVFFMHPGEFALPFTVLSVTVTVSASYDGDGLHQQSASAAWEVEDRVKCSSLRHRNMSLIDQALIKLQHTIKPHGWFRWKSMQSSTTKHEMHYTTSMEVYSMQAPSGLNIVYDTASLYSIIHVVFGFHSTS